LAPSIPSSAPLADQAALELGNTAHDGHHKPAHIDSGVLPSLAEGDKLAPSLGEVMEYVVHIAAGSGETIQLGHDYGVAGEQGALLRARSRLANFG
jgi:hypothetical protein